MTAPADALQQAIMMLWDDYASKPGQIAEIEELWRRLLADDAPVAELQDVVRMVHGIAGSGATLGLAVVSDAARELWRFLALIGADAGFPDHFPPFRDFFLEESQEFFQRASGGIGALPLLNDP